MRRAAWFAVSLALVLTPLVGCEGRLGGHGREGEDGAGAGASDQPDYDLGDNGATDNPRSLAFYYGPMKLMLGESALYSIAAITGHDFGGWEASAPDPGTDAFADAGNGDGDYYRHCRLLGGCMEHRIPLARTSFVGTAYVLELEKAVAVACGDRDAFGMFPGGTAPGPSAQVVDIVDHQYRRAFSAPPTTSELELSIEYFESHLADPEMDDVSPLESAGRGHCRAILASSRFLFY